MKKSISLLLIVFLLPVGSQGHAFNSPLGPTNALNLSNSYPAYTPNVIENGDLNATDSNNLPLGWNVGTSGRTRTELTLEDAHGGVQSLKMSAQGYFSSQGTNVYRYPSSNVYAKDDLTLDLWMRVLGTNKSLGDVYLYVQMTDGSNSYYFFFYFVANTLGSNSSSSFYFNSSISLNIWQNSVIDLTLAASQTIGLLPGLRINQLRLYTNSIAQAPTSRIVYLDDLSLSNTTYEEFPSGDFEADMGGLIAANDYDPGTFNVTNGILNLDAHSPNGIQTYVSAGRTFSGSDAITIVPGTVLSLDYLYQGTNESNEQARVYLNLYNGSFSLFVYIYLGNSSVISPPSNFTSSTYGYLYLFPGQQTGWTHFDLDFDILRSFLGTSFLLVTLEFYASSPSIPSTQALFQVDKVSLLNPPASDPGFEYAWPNGFGSSMLGWVGSSYPSLNRSEDAFEGNYSAHLTSETGSVSISRSMDVDFDTSGVFTDFQIKLLDVDVSSNSYAYVALQFDVGTLAYVFAYNASSIVAFNSSTYKYLLMNIPQGSWQTFTRDLEADLLATFGDSSVTLTSLSISTYRTGSDRIEFLVDSMDFILDTLGPELKEIEGPTEVYYHESPQWNLVVEDELKDVSKVWVNYQVSGSWLAVPATYNGSAYSVAIPQLPYGTDVAYYFQANDTLGNISTFNSSSYFYSVGDDIPPVAEIRLGNNSVVQGTIDVTISAVDVGSNISSVQLLIDGTPLMTLSNGPFTFSLNTRDLANGVHQVQARAVDNAGQEVVTQAITIIVDNDLEGPAISSPLVLPKEPQAGVPAVVVVSVVDQSNITSVKLHYRTEGGSWQEQEMVGENGLYNGTLPAISVGEVLEYYISATDEFNQTGYRGTETDPFTYSLATQGVVENILAQAKGYYQQYEFVAGILAAFSSLLVLKLIGSRFSKKK